MNNEQANEFEAFLQERISCCTKKSQALFKDDRKDEAVFEKVRANVYDIFKTVFSVAAKNEKDAQAAETFFLAKLEQIPSAWVQSLEQAQQHGDSQKAHIETIKLDAVREIREKFAQITE